MILEYSVDKAVSKLYSNKDSIHKDFINEELGFISIENNIETGILIIKGLRFIIYFNLN